MRRITVLLCVLLAGCARSQGADATQTAAASPAASSISEETGFPPVPNYQIDARDHTDDEVKVLIASLRTLVSKQTDASKWQKDAELHFWRLQNRLERARLSEVQEANVLGAIEMMATEHPQAKDYLIQRKWMIQHLGIGKEVPEIVAFDSAT